MRPKWEWRGTWIRMKGGGGCAFLKKHGLWGEGPTPDFVTFFRGLVLTRVRVCKLALQRRRSCSSFPFLSSFSSHEYWSYLHALGLRSAAPSHSLPSHSGPQFFVWTVQIVIFFFRVFFTVLFICLILQVTLQFNLLTFDVYMLNMQ